MKSKIGLAFKKCKEEKTHRIIELKPKTIPFDQIIFTA